MKISENKIKLCLYKNKIHRVLNLSYTVLLIFNQFNLKLIGLILSLQYLYNYEKLKQKYEYCLLNFLFLIFFFAKLNFFHFLDFTSTKINEKKFF